MKRTGMPGAIVRRACLAVITASGAWPGIGAGMGRPTVIGRDDRVEMLTNAYPYSAVGKLLTGQEDCTAALLWRNLILTNAHCVLEADGRTRAPLWFQANMVDDSIRMRVGLEPRGIPPTSVKASVIAHGAYRPGEFAEDWAILSLASPVGDAFNWFEMADADPAPGSDVALAGYSLDRYGERGTASVHAGCHLSARDGALWRHDCDSASGASGSPVFVLTVTGDVAQSTLVALHAGGGDDHNVALPVATFRKAWAEALASARAVIGDKPPPPRRYRPPEAAPFPPRDPDPPPPAGLLPVDFCGNGVDEDGDGADRACDVPPGRRPVMRQIVIREKGPAAGIVVDRDELTWPEGSEPLLTVINQSRLKVSFDGNLTSGWLEPADALPTPDVLTASVGVPGHVRFSLAWGEAHHVRFARVPATPPRGVETLRWRGTYTEPGQAPWAAEVSVSSHRTHVCGGGEDWATPSLDQCAGMSQCQTSPEVTLRLADPDSGDEVKSYTWVPNGCSSFGDRFAAQFAYQPAAGLRVTGEWVSRFGNSAVSLRLEGPPLAPQGSVRGLLREGGEGQLALKPAPSP